MLALGVIAVCAVLYLRHRRKQERAPALQGPDVFNTTRQYSSQGHQPWDDASYGMIYSPQAPSHFTTNSMSGPGAGQYSSSISQQQGACLMRTHREADGSRGWAWQVLQSREVNAPSPSPRLLL